MAEKKSILEEALLDIKNIQSALNANTKEILRSVAKEEIDSVVKESLMTEIYEEEDMDSEDMNEGMESDEKKEEMTEGMYEEDKSDDMMEMEKASEEVAPKMESEMGMNSEELDMDAMDMTSASDDEVLAIYKKLSGDDEIEIVGDEIHLSISEPGDYIVKMGGESEVEDMESDEMEDEMGDEDGVDYEIEMGDEESDEESTPEDLVPADEDETEEEELTEAIPVGSGQAHRLPGKANIGQPKGAGADNLKESVAAKKLVSETTKKYNALLTEATKLKSENEEFRKALKVFRNQLVETVVFNSNLTYTTRLFMEHSTTKAEKQAIIKRFDTEVSNLVESKKLYKTIASELENRKPINESLENKIIKEVTTSSSKQLNESTAYVDPSTKRIKDLISRVENR